MPLETAVHINDLVITNPQGTDNRLQGDDHIRMLKAVLKTDLPLTTPATALGISLLTAASQSAAREALGVPTDSAFRNRVVNGDFAIDSEHQGAVVTVTAGAALKHVIDGWYAYCTGANVTFQTTTVAGRKRARFTGLAGNTAVGFAHRILAEDSADMASAFATLRMLLSSSSITTVNWGLYYANSTDSFGTVASPTRTTIQTGSFTITSTEAAFSAITSAALAAGATTGLELVITVGALLGSQTLTIGDAQIEKGSIATPVFEVLPKERQNLRCLYRAGRINILVTTTAFSQQSAYKVVPRSAPVLTLISFSTGTGATVSNQTLNSYTDSIIQNAAHSAIATAQYYYDARP